MKTVDPFLECLTCAIFATYTTIIIYTRSLFYVIIFCSEKKKSFFAWSEFVIHSQYSQLLADSLLHSNTAKCLLFCFLLLLYINRTKDVNSKRTKIECLNNENKTKKSEKNKPLVSPYLYNRFHVCE